MPTEKYEVRARYIREAVLWVEVEEGGNPYVREEWLDHVQEGADSSPKVEVVSATPLPDPLPAERKEE